MAQQPRKRSTKLLWGLMLLATVYSGWLHERHTLSGSITFDGVAGVALGLYICSLPAAAAIDLLFFERGALEDLFTEWSGRAWLALNGLAVLVGWLVIVVGATRLVG